MKESPGVLEPPDTPYYQRHSAARSAIYVEGVANTFLSEQARRELHEREVSEWQKTKDAICQYLEENPLIRRK